MWVTRANIYIFIFLSTRNKSRSFNRLSIAKYTSNQNENPRELCLNCWLFFYHYPLNLRNQQFDFRVALGGGRYCYERAEQMRDLHFLTFSAAALFPLTCCARNQTRLAQTHFNLCTNERAL